MQNSSKNQKGFSVIEIVVSLFIFGIVLLIYSAASNSTILNRAAKNHETAFRIANTEIENLRGTAYASLPAGGSISNPLLATLPGAATETLAVSVYNTKTKQLQVTVSWTEPNSSTRSSVSLVTLITQGGLGQ